MVVLSATHIVRRPGRDATVWMTLPPVSAPGVDEPEVSTPRGSIYLPSWESLVDFDQQDEKEITVIVAVLERLGYL